MGDAFHRPDILRECEDDGPAEVVPRRDLSVLERVNQGRLHCGTAEPAAVHHHIARSKRTDATDSGAEMARVAKALVAAGQQPQQRRIVTAVTIDRAMTMHEREVLIGHLARLVVRGEWQFQDRARGALAGFVGAAIVRIGNRIEQRGANGDGPQIR